MDDRDFKSRLVVKMLFFCKNVMACKSKINPVFVRYLPPRRGLQEKIVDLNLTFWGPGAEKPKTPGGNARGDRGKKKKKKKKIKRNLTPK
ncbi:MAG: hypothetical protein IPO07_27445 [Haliscomenobacter sp.]|nr:hypothetical protein [Haliscomenobacter sp.]MBK9492117.1 hypothetical protein [Haliscomenobacter sp.]